MGHNAGWLGAALLILATNRREINPSYTTMPEFSKSVRVVDELRP